MRIASSSSLEARLGGGLGKLILALLIAGPLLNVHAWLQALPTLLQAAMVLGAGAYIVQKMLSFPRWHDETRHLVKFVRAVAGLLAIVVLENFCTWATSASDLRKHEYVPLQDNVEISTLWALRTVPGARALLFGWRVDMHWLLYAFVSLCLSVIWNQVPFSGFGMGARFMDAIAWTHALRTAAFMVTVLPNPRPGCYAKSFPPVPSTLLGFLAVGFSAKRGSGCNDLVISGHGVVYAAVPLALQTFYPGGKGKRGWLPRAVAATAWAAVTKLCLQEVVDKTHYSVDMLLAVACTALVWRWREGVYPTTAAWKERSKGAPPDPVPRKLIALTVGVLVLVFVGVKGV